MATVNEVIEWKRNNLKEFEAICNYTPEHYDPVFSADARAAYFLAKKRYKESYDSYYFLALVEYALPLQHGFLHFVRNHPFEFTEYLEKCSSVLGVNCSIPGQLRDSDENLFNNLIEMTRYGLHLLFSHIEVSGDIEKQLISAIEYQDYDEFQRLCERYAVNWTSLKKTTGLFSILDAYDAEMDRTDDEAKLDELYKDALFLFGITTEQLEQAFKEVLVIGEYRYSDLEEEEIKKAAAIVMVAFSMYRLCDIMEPYECRIVDDLLTKPEYSCFSCAAQRAYYHLFDKLPDNVTALISIESSVAGNGEQVDQDTQIQGFELPLVLPQDFFTNSEYIDETKIKPLPMWVKEGDDKPGTFASMINYLVNMKYLGPSLGNRRLLASLLSGRKLDTGATSVEWLIKEGKTLVDTERVMLWLCKFLYAGNRGFYEKAYSVLWGNNPRSYYDGAESANANNADKTVQQEIKGMYPNRPK